jgi:uncharacterized protein (TIGR02757 family)
VLDTLGERPAERLLEASGRQIRAAMAGFRHRFTSGEELAAMLLAIRRILRDHGSVEKRFLAGLRRDDETVLPAISALVGELSSVAGRPFTFLLPDPGRGSACKRLNLYLRWMVRADSVDLGVWSGVARSQLIVPLDVHVVRLGQCLGLTRYRSPGWKMASEITASLRRLDPDDPVRYDFALCHVGMRDQCGLNRPFADSRCPLRGWCRPGRRTPPASRRPSGRR